MKHLVLIIGLILLVSTALVAQISAPYTQNFDTMTANQVPSQDWTTIVQGTGSGLLIIGGVNARSAPNFARIAASTGTSILISPEVENLDSCNLKFWVRIVGTAPLPNLIVGVMSDNTDPDSFVPVQTITGLSLIYQEVEINLSSHAANGPYIAFKHGNVSAARNILIDDVSLELLATSPVFNVSPISKNFGLIGVGDGLQSQPQSFNISNIGIGTLGINSIAITGEDSGDFILSAEPENYPVNLGASESIAVSVVFSPASVGSKNAVLQILDDLGRTINEVPLSGEGYIPPVGATCLDPIISTMPITDHAGELNLTFGNEYASSWISPASTYLNGIDVVYQFTLLEESYLSGSVAGAGSRTGLFILSTCPDPLSPAVVLVKGEGINGGSFANYPLGAGTFIAIVSSSLTSSPIPYTLNLSAVAAGSPNPVISPLEKDFGQTVLGMEKTQVFTISNPGGSGLSILSVSLEGVNASNFAITSQPSDYPADVDFAQQISLTIRFAPIGEGSKTANLIIVDNLAKTQHSIPLSGIGFKQFEGGNGTAGNPFQINDVEQFNQLREYLGATHTNVHFIQTADFDLGSSAWIPIGTQANPFYGNLDGNGYKIFNLTISKPIVNATDNNNQGLFAATNSAYLKNLALINASVSGYNMLGAIVGIVTSTTIEDSYSTGTLTGYGNIGGLVGQSSNSVIRSSYSSTNISGVNSLGGILGLQSSTVNPAILNCFATGNITQTATGTGIGGLVGLAFSGQVHNSFALGTINGFGTPSATWGGLIGNVLGNLSFNSYYNSETSGMSDSNKGLPRTTAEMTIPYAENTYIGWDFENAWGADFAGVMNGGYPYLRSFGTSISSGAIEIVTPDQITLDSGIDSTHPVVVALPNYANLSNTVVFGLNGTGTVDLSVSVGAGNWYGMVYFNSSWHTSTPPFVVGPGHLTFLNVEFGAKADVIVVLSENEDPTLPVELSSFDAVLTADMFVALSWIVESETNHSGYNVLRNDELSLTSAIRLNAELISNGQQNATQITYSFTDKEIENNTLYYYWLESIDLDGSITHYGPISVLVGHQDENSDSPELPLRTELLSSYPNPFNPQTNISYSIHEATEVRIDIYNLKGQIIRSYQRSHFQPGVFSVTWDGTDRSGKTVSSGVYFYRMISRDYQATKKMLMAK